MRWITCLDRRDFAQERALALLEGRDPKGAVRAYLRQEHRFYDMIAPLTERGSWAQAPLPLPPPKRSPESIERRRAYTREWWRRNGQAYRRERAGRAS